ncbi:DUF434 domain-containing protein [Methanobacterium sp.]|uniref:DUF434 domain-containing protein n=1 Tax=Methanobacterium sp. TaxID=2164 RepID=UPI003D64AA57
MQIKKDKINEAVYDLRFLLNRGYRKKNALQFVSNKYLLSKRERNYLARSVFSNLKSESRGEKIVEITQIENKYLLVDGYNVLITTESICQRDYESLILCDDMILRDLNAVFGKYKFKDSTKKALNAILELINEYNPAYVNFLFDSPVSFSAKLAKLTNEIMQHYGIQGSTNVSKNVDFEIIESSKTNNGVVATGDSVIIDKIDKVVDIPFIILQKYKTK